MGESDGERVLLAVRRGGFTNAFAMVITLGSYWFWWRAGVLTVSSREVAWRSGLLLQREHRVLPVDRIQDVSVTHWLTSSSLVMSTAGGTPSNTRIGPLGRTSATRAGELIRNLIGERSYAAARHSGASQPVPALSSIPDQIEQLSRLRDIGALTAEEFQAKKTELLSRM